MASELNRRVKRWPGWVALIFVVAGFLAVGATRDTGPESQGDRIDELSKRVACPICDGESVFESQNNASIALRNQIADLVADNDLNDTEIIAFIETRYGAQVLLVPKSSGFDALVWVLPAVAFACGLAALVVVFRRWKREAGEVARPDRCRPSAGRGGPRRRSRGRAADDRQRHRSSTGLATLEEERRFLLRSLTDLEREHDAGDVDDLDYQTLKDGYTVRAAKVLREIEEGRGELPAPKPRRWSRVIAVTAAVVVGLDRCRVRAGRCVGRAFVGPGDHRAHSGRRVAHRAHQRP